MSCMICGEKETRHINLYIMGSEGFDACHACEMVVVGFIRDLQQISAAVKKNVIQLKEIERRANGDSTRRF